MNRDGSIVQIGLNTEKILDDLKRFPYPSTDAVGVFYSPSRMGCVM